MANYFPKQKRGYYEQNSQLSGVLKNLRGYRLATGDVSPAKLAKARNLHGDDEGKVCGSLLSARREEPASSRHTKHKRRKKKRRQSNSDHDVTPSLYTSQAINKPAKKRHKPSSALGMLSTYSDSEDSDKYEVPPVVRNMFSEPTQTTVQPTESAKVKTNNKSRGVLGFFGEESSSSDDQDVDPHDLPISTTPHPDVSNTILPVLSTDAPLTTYLCWKCSKVGHLPQDCTVAISTKSCSKVKISSQLQAQYKKCREIKARRGDRCAECGIHSNLACCLECGYPRIVCDCDRLVLCDGRGHLASHLSQHPTHSNLYSYKLQRMLKCCKATCDVVDIYELLMCSVCLGKSFTQHYSMVSATWSRTGLRAIPNALCCEEHFQWHRINCPNAAEEHFVSSESLREHSGPNGLISEFFL